MLVFNVTLAILNSTLLKQPFIESVSEISECEGDKEFKISGGTFVYLKRVAANRKLNII